MLLVVNANDELGRKGEGYVTFFDPETGEQLAKVNEGGITAHEVVTSPDGRFAYAPIYSNVNLGQPGTDGSTMAVIDVDARKVVDTIDFGRGLGRFRSLEPDGRPDLRDDRNCEFGEYR